MCETGSVTDIFPACEPTPVNQHLPWLSVLTRVLLLLLLAPNWCRSQEFDERFELWPVNLRTRGTLAVASSLSSPADLQPLWGTGSESSVALVLSTDVAPRRLAEYQRLFEGRDDPITIARREQLSLEGLKSLVEEHDTIIWEHIKSPGPQEIAQVVKLSDEFQALLERGGTLVGIGPVCGFFGSLLTEPTSDPQAAQTAPTAVVTAGLDLLPDTVVVGEYRDTPARRGDLLSILARHPRKVGIGLAPNTTLVLQGRLLRVVGSGSATLVLMANDREPVKVQTISAPQSRRQSPDTYLADLTQWRREAIDRTVEPFPPAKPEVPHVPHGTLVIVGGGGMPSGLMDRFVQLAGGTDDARLVYVPCSEQESVGERQRTVEAWKRMGVKHATFIHTKDRVQANEDPDFYAPLAEATGIWFGGGRQWNFADSYYGTTTHKLMKDVLKRGGVIGGSSAGASIQARYLARATPIQNFKIMAPGYERGGLGFISGVAIDQHFTQRGRQKDMTQLVNRYPQLLGIGLDEATAIIVRQSVANVVGRGKAHFYDRNLPVYPGKADFVALPAGSLYDLAERREILPPTPMAAEAPE